jgi:hypothetical protein
MHRRVMKCEECLLASSDAGMSQDIFSKNQDRRVFGTKKPPEPSLGQERGLSDGFIFTSSAETVMTI